MNTVTGNDQAASVTSECVCVCVCVRQWLWPRRSAGERALPSGLDRWAGQLWWSDGGATGWQGKRLSGPADLARHLSASGTRGDRGSALCFTVSALNLKPISTGQRSETLHVWDIHKHWRCFISFLLCARNNSFSKSCNNALTFSFCIKFTFLLAH